MLSLHVSSVVSGSVSKSPVIFVSVCFGCYYAVTRNTFLRLKILGLVVQSCSSLRGLERLKLQQAVVKHARVRRATVVEALSLTKIPQLVTRDPQFKIA